MYFSIQDKHLRLKPIPGKPRFFTVVTPFYYQLTLRGVQCWIMIPTGFTTDLMSGPKKLKQSLGIQEGDYRLSAIVHDYLYAKRIISTSTGTFKCTRKEADEIIIECIELEQYMEDMESYDHHNNIFLNSVIYKFLRNWGWLAWYRHRLIDFLWGE